MSDRVGRCGKALELLIILTLVTAAPAATLLWVSPPALAGPCDQVGGVITGDWTITTAQVCAGIVYTVDGSVNINSGGSLTLIDGGLKFAKDASHSSYSLNVNAGGELVLDNSIVTTQTQAIDPYLKLAFTVSGVGSRLTMRNGATLRFPGWLNATSATLDITDSTITGFTSTDLTGLGVYQGDNDDSPLLNWASTTASLYGSRVERIYENTSVAGGGNSTGIVSGNVSLRTGSTLYAYDSYIGVDYSNILGFHNELQVDGSSNAFLYGVTIDRTQDPTSMSNWRPAFVPLAAGGSIYLLRWLRLTAVDETGFPVSGATVWSTLSPSSTTAQYPDNGLSTTPSARTLSYLGRTASGPTAWNRTGSDGVAVIPLYTDQITTTSLPNAESFGNYHLTVTFGTAPVYTTSSGVDFDAYPAVDSTANTQPVTATFAGLQVRTGPDLLLRQSDYATTLTVIQNQAFTVYALIYNQGQTDATGVSIGAYLNGDLGVQLRRVDGLTVTTAPGGVNQSLSIPGVGTLGTQGIMLVVDPDNAVIEGGVAQESNNFANITLNVVPPPNGFTAILTPSLNQVVEPGSALSVTGYVRDDSSVGIVGVPLLIELRSGTSVITSNTTTSQSPDGFFLGTINVPANQADGSYTIVVTPSSGPISPDTRAVEVRRSVSFLNQTIPFLGLPMWFLLVIVIIVVVLVIGMTLYFKVFGLGKMVECGECGSFISQDSTACPKCGVEFEKEMAKCSNCQAWIPVDVKQCPECGVEFATGKVEMADYQEKMRMQYEDVAQKFRRTASSQLGRTLSEAEFQDWWRKQPTFVTFEDWLREEEEMRKMGSKACPVCNTLNSVTATVCHKCGTYLRETARPPSGRPPPRRAAPAGEETEDAGPAPSDPVPAKVVRKPGPPIVTPAKKVPARPIEEGSEGESGGDDTDVSDL